MVPPPEETFSDSDSDSTSTASYDVDLDSRGEPWSKLGNDYSMRRSYNEAYEKCKVPELNRPLIRLQREILKDVWGRIRHRGLCRIDRSEAPLKLLKRYAKETCATCTLKSHHKLVCSDCGCFWCSEDCLIIQVGILGCGAYGNIEQFRRVLHHITDSSLHLYDTEFEDAIYLKDIYKGYATWCEQTIRSLCFEGTGREKFLELSRKHQKEFRLHVKKDLETMEKEENRKNPLE